MSEPKPTPPVPPRPKTRQNPPPINRNTKPKQNPPPINRKTKPTNPINPYPWIAQGPPPPPGISPYFFNEKFKDINMDTIIQDKRYKEKYFNANYVLNKIGGTIKLIAASCCNTDFTKYQCSDIMNALIKQEGINYVINLDNKTCINYLPEISQRVNQTTKFLFDADGQKYFYYNITKPNIENIKKIYQLISSAIEKETNTKEKPLKIMVQCRTGVMRTYKFIILLELMFGLFDSPFYKQIKIQKLYIKELVEQFYSYLGRQRIEMPETGRKDSDINDIVKILGKYYGITQKPTSGTISRRSTFARTAFKKKQTRLSDIENTLMLIINFLNKEIKLNLGNTIDDISKQYKNLELNTIKIKESYKEKYKKSLNPAYVISRYRDMKTDNPDTIIKKKDAEKNEFFNANYVLMGNGVEIIASECPASKLPNKNENMLQLIEQEQVDLIINLTKYEEKGRTKCTQYFGVVKDEEKSPDVYGHTDTKAEEYRYIGSEKIGLEEVIDNNNNEDRSILINYHAHELRKGDREVRFIHYKDWPDHGAPGFDIKGNFIPSDKDEINKFFNFIIFVFEYISKTKTKKLGGHIKILVHCSAGVGRTGTFIVLLELLFGICNSYFYKEFNKKKDITNINKFIYYLRLARHNKMVQTPPQYALIKYMCLDNREYAAQAIRAAESQAGGKTKKHTKFYNKTKKNNKLYKKQTLKNKTKTNNKVRRNKRKTKKN